MNVKVTTILVLLMAVLGACGLSGSNAGATSVVVIPH